MENAVKNLKGARPFPKTYALTIINIYNGFGNASLAMLHFAIILR